MKTNDIFRPLRQKHLKIKDNLLNKWNKQPITKGNYLKIEHIECNECGAVLDWNTVNDAIKKYGLIALQKRSTGSGYFGYTCPKCLKTNLEETNEDFLRLILANKILSPKALFSRTTVQTMNYESISTSDGVFRNKSLITLISYDKENLPTIEKHRLNKMIPGNATKEIKKQLESHLSDCYCSYIPGSSYIEKKPTLQFLTDNPNLMETVKSWRYDKIFSDLKKFIEIQFIASDGDIIQQCKTHENLTGKKVFNRYICEDETNSLNNKFYSKFGKNTHLMPLGDDIAKKLDVTKFELNKIKKNVTNINPKYTKWFSDLKSFKRGSSDKKDDSTIPEKKDNRFGLHIFDSLLPHKHNDCEPADTTHDVESIDQKDICCSASTNVPSNIGTLCFKHDDFDPENCEISDDNDEQLSFEKILNFLEVLCLQQLHKTIEKELKIYPSDEASKTEEDDPIFSQFQDSYSNLWKKENTVTELLKVMADNYLEEFNQLNQRIDFSTDQLSVLKEKYTSDIVNSIQSPQAIKEKTKIETDKFKRRIEKIEANYPELKKIITRNYKMNQIKEKLISICDSNIIDSFLLRGETGTGKELFAKAIHQLSGKKGTFIPKNCASIPANMFEGEFFGHKKGAFTGADKDRTGAFEQAEDGTIFLDEIGELEIEHQARFLRVLQEKEVSPVGGRVKTIDFQTVSATNQDLKDLISKKQFREDLFHRINDYTINIPSLIERKDDIDLLVHHFINKYDRALSEDPSLAPLIVEKKALKMLEDYNWPGNVRELEKVCKLVMAFRDITDRSEIRINEFSLRKSDIPKTSKSPDRPVKSKNLPGNTKITPDQVRQAMKNNNGNKTKAAKELGVTYHTILRHCKELGI